MTIKVLFVCLGNICRSPAAEGIFKHLVKAEDRLSQFEIDSAGTSRNHSGELPDKRMREHALKRGIVLDSHARQFQPDDFERFDYILVMDDKNLKDVLALANSEQTSKVIPFVKFCSSFQITHVPDPYFSGPEGFEHVLDIVTDGSKGLIDFFKREKKW